MKRVLITGATGFVGRNFCEYLNQRGYVVRAVVRAGNSAPHSVEQIDVGSIGPETQWAAALEGVDIVCHLAAIAHLQSGLTPDDDVYFHVNALGTRRLAEAAAATGVKRIVYLSSVKVNGEMTLDRPYRRSDTPAPQDAYARSKWHGEQYLQEMARRTGIESVIVRPPLVYGPGVRANFLRLLAWVDRGLPIPLGAVSNSRSLVSIWNLISFLACCLDSEAARANTWMVSDGADISTPDLIRCIGAAMQRRVRLISVPPSLLIAGASLMRRSAEMDRLCGSLTVDISDTCRALGWTPPVSREDSIERTVRWYLDNVRENRS